MSKERKTCKIGRAIDLVANVQGRLHNSGGWNQSEGILGRALTLMHEAMCEAPDCCNKCSCCRKCKCGG